MSDNGSVLSSRSSSQTSRASKESKKTKTRRGAPKRAGSKTSPTPPQDHDPSLTSFPSFSPEPDIKGEQKSSKKNPNMPVVARTISQKTRDRKATLVGLTSGAPAIGQNALFDDSPRSSADVPGSLHLANDEHIERLIVRTGAVKLIRQYAQDLAQRDAEISKLRVRADNRERELKRLLRAADVSSADIEKTLMRLEQGDAFESQEQARNGRTSVDGLMNEAMASEMTLSAFKPVNEIGLATSAHPSTPSLVRSILGVMPAKGSTMSSRHTSRTSSITSIPSEDMDATLRPRVPSSSASKLQSIFQPPSQASSYFIGGKPSKKPKASDEISVRSNQSSKSYSSWTQIFGGKSQTGRARALSLEQGMQPPSEAESSLAKLTKTKTQPVSIRGSSNLAPGNALKGKPGGRQTPTSSRQVNSANHARKESNASNLPLTVELDSVLQPDTLPPTMTANNTDTSGVLTDRFGFVYDQRRRKRQSLSVPKHKRNRLSGVDVVALRAGGNPARDPVDRAPTPMSIDEETQKKPWQDYLKPSLNFSAGRPKELLMHTPSAAAVVTVNTAGVEGTITPPSGGRGRGMSMSAADRGLLPSVASVSEPQSTAVTATQGEGDDDDDDGGNDSTPSKLLLDQLNELHDSLQSDRMVKWNEFLRRVRAERAINADLSSNNAPEAELLDGELIGVASLGRSAKQRSKYNHFKGLVLAGIPVQLRPKIWSEASGASARRIPGYYEDLILRAEEGTDIHPDISIQIKADIRRTLTDNVFFQTGPGVRRLEEVLRAYSLHNPSIGYCQGMNLITASLLLICATPEDCFWLLVAVIDTILPSGYFSGSLLTARADQIVLREYVTQLLPTLSTKLEDLGVELEACTFHWFLSLYAGVLTGGEALYRIWDIVLTLHSTDATPNFTSEARNLGVDFSALSLSTPTTPVTAAADSGSTTDDVSNAGAEIHDGTSSPFLFQIALSLLFLNQTQIMQLESAAQVYTFINHNMTDHGVSLDSLIRAAEALGGKVKREEVLERRERATKSLG